MLENKVYVFDNLIPRSYQDYLENLFYLKIPFLLGPPSISSSGHNHPQQESQYTISSNHNFKDKIYDKSQMSCTFVNEKIVFNNDLHKLIPLYNFIQSYFNYSFHYEIIRCKANLKHQQNISYTNKFNPPHVDKINNKNLWILIYYINDSDGDTVLFKESLTSGNKISNFTIDQTISPKKGRLIFFPCHRYHSSNFPTQYPTRLILNNVIEILPV